jgi:hypothetical protein
MSPTVKGYFHCFVCCHNILGHRTRRRSGGEGVRVPVRLVRGVPGEAWWRGCVWSVPPPRRRTPSMASGVRTPIGDQCVRASVPERSARADIQRNARCSLSIAAKRRREGTAVVTTINEGGECKNNEHLYSRKHLSTSGVLQSSFFGTVNVPSSSIAKNGQYNTFRSLFLSREGSLGQIHQERTTHRIDRTCFVPRVRASPSWRSTIVVRWERLPTRNGPASTAA